MHTKSYADIIEILKTKDPTFDKIVAATKNPTNPTPSTDIYLSLLNSIVSQQLSVKVAKVIWQRFNDLFPASYPGPEKITQMEVSELRTCGLSNSKANYIKNVAQFSMDNDISFNNLNTLSDDDIITFLTQIKGVGKWTVQMILMFPMDRPDVFPVDDLGIQTSMKYWYNLDLEKSELKAKLIQLADKWSPYKTLACKYLWRSITK